MKIIIFTNTFETYHRQTVAIDSWRHMKSLFPDIIEIVDFQFSNDINMLTQKDILRSHTLNPTKEIVQGEKQLPFISDMFENAYKCSGKTDDVWLLWINSDCIITKHLILDIIENKPNMRAYSRIDIQDVPSFDDIASNKTSLQFIRTEPAGFDAIAVNANWYRENHRLFGYDFVIGRPLFDVYLAGISMLYANPPGGLGNDKSYLLHIWHETTSHNNDKEKQWNEKIVNDNPIVKLVINIMYYHLQYNICKRPDWGSFLQIPKEEKTFEKQYFDALNFTTEKVIRRI